MRIKEITIKKLFGIFDYTIPLNLDDRITIIHAPNGFGKTNILEIINGLFNNDYPIPFAVPFEEFRVEFNEGTLLSISKKLSGSYYTEQANESEDDELRQIIKAKFPEIVLTLNNNTERFFFRPVRLNSRAISELVDQLIPELEQADPKHWINRVTNEKLSLTDVLDLFGYTLLKNIFQKEFTKMTILDWWTEFQKNNNVRFIQTQRLQNSILEPKQSSLLHRIRGKNVLTVEQCASDLSEEIQDKLTEFAALSQSLDRKFPSRLLEQMNKQDNSSLTSEQINNELYNLETKRLELGNLGILDKDIDASFSVPEKANVYTKEVLVIYLQDMKEKLKTFEEIASKINLFKEIITKKFLYKEIIFSRESGFYFISSDGSKLPLNALSSGEQHELVLNYQLLFKTKPDSLILIDEPEMSLHVSWQREFLKDLNEIAKLAKLDFILATHSPSIINDRWDLTVNLRDQVTNE
jgi:predicted ATP-binding protein involved in virulence